MKKPNMVTADEIRFTRNNFHSQIRKSSLFIFVERLIGATVSFLTTVFILRSLSVEDYGIYSILLSIMVYVGLFSSLGLPSLFQRFIPEFYQKDEIGRLRIFVRKGLLWRFILAAALIALLLIFSTPLGKLLRFGRAVEYLELFAIAIIFYLETSLQGAVLTSVFRHSWYAIAQVSYVCLRAGILFFLLNKGFGLEGLLIGESVAYSLLFVFQQLFYRKFLAAHPARGPSDLPFKRLVRFGGFTFFNEVGAHILSDSSDLFIISAFLGPTAVGIYAFATRMMTLATHILPQSVFMNVIRPTFFSNYVQSDDPNRVNRMFNLLVKLIAFFSTPLVMAIVILGDKMILYMFDPKYSNSLHVLWIVAFFTFFNFFFEPIGLVLQSIEKVEILFFSKIFAVYNLVTSILWVGPYGIMGVAVSTGTAILFKNLFCYLLARKHVHLHLQIKSLVVIMINALVMGGAIFLMRSRVDNLFVLIVVCGVGIVIYGAMAVLNKAFSSSERKLINSILPKPIFVF